MEENIFVKNKDGSGFVNVGKLEELLNTHLCPAYDYKQQMDYSNYQEQMRHPFKYEFKETGLGNKVDVVCVCGKIFDVTDYDSW